MNRKNFHAHFILVPTRSKLRKICSAKFSLFRPKTGERVSGIIVETEAYLGAEDKAAHSYNNRRTKRTETMFAVGGTVYIFFIYGMYFQFNIVVGEIDTPHAILVRAVEPFENIEIMRERRGKNEGHESYIGSRKTLHRARY